MAAGQLERLPIERIGRVNGEERTKCQGKSLFGLGR